MKVKKSIFLLLTLLIVTATIAGCGSGKKGPLDGKWAYNHDLKTAALTIDSNGKAVLDDVKYDCVYDDSYITLTNQKSGTQKLRYKFAGDNILLYKTAEYVYSGEGTPADIIGVWDDTPNNWSYEFTEEGKFLEDGFFPGTYERDDKAGTVTLTYDDGFKNTVIYYSISGNVLTIEYPWEMVRIN